MVWPRKDVELQIELPAIVDAKILATLYQMVRDADERADRAESKQGSPEQEYRYAREVLRQLADVPEDATDGTIVDAFMIARKRAVELLTIYGPRGDVGI